MTDQDIESADLIELTRRIADKYMAETPNIRIADQRIESVDDALIPANPGTGPFTPVVRTVVAVPYEGDPELFELKPIGTVSIFPQAQLRTPTNDLLLIIDTPTANAGEVRDAIDKQTQLILQWLKMSWQDIQRHNTEVQDLATNRLTHRADGLAKRRQMVTDLGIPFGKREDAERFAVPVTRRILTSKISPPRTDQPSPEYYLEQQDYEAAAQVLCNARDALERAPSTAAHLGEEAIRDLMLVFLNAIFAGNASGELFNGHGKTDILIRVEGRNVFVCECKIWRGPTSITAALNQLLRRYLVWRDTKAALAIIYRGKNPTADIAKTVATIEADPLHRNTKPSPDDAYRHDFEMVSEQDGERRVQLALLPFILPTRRA